MAPKRKLSDLSMLFSVLFARGNFTVSTWLLLGASVQCMLFRFLPPRVASLPCIIALAYRFIRTQLQIKGLVHNPDAESITYGRATAQYPAADGTATSPFSSESIVVFVLLATYSHPSGVLSPGSQELGEFIVPMWRDAETNREKYGYLGNTPAMVPERSGDIYGTRNHDDEGYTIMYVSYWKTLDGLHAFARAGAHQKGWLWWDREALKKYPHIGVGHETYEVPAEKWENIYHNFRPFGLGHAKFPVQSEDGDVASESGTSWVSGLRPVRGKEWKSMEGRMGKAAGSVGLQKKDD